MSAGEGLVGGEADEEPHVFAALFDEAESELRVDGEAVAEGEAGTFPLGGVTLGASFNDANFLKGDIAAVLVFNRRLPATQIEDVEAYLQDKYFGAGTGTLQAPSYAPVGKEGDAGEGTGAVAVSEPAEGLASGTTYRYRAVAESEGGTSYGAKETLTTAPSAPATTEAATEVSAHGATLNATISPEGSPTGYWFEYWPKGAYPLPGGAALWYEADQIEGEDGSKVASWPDESGNERDATQAEEAEQPVLETEALNGKPVVHFDGEDDLLRDTGFKLSQPNTVFVVGKTDRQYGAFIDGTESYYSRNMIQRHYPKNGR